MELGLDLFLFLAATFTAALLAGLAGFAFGIVAASAWLHILTPVQTATLIVWFGLIVQGYAVRKLRHSTRWSRFAPMVLGSACGIPLGVYALSSADPRSLHVAIGAVLIAYALYCLLRPTMRPVTAPRRVGGWRSRFFQWRTRWRDRICGHCGDDLEPVCVAQGPAARYVSAGRLRDIHHDCALARQP
jgi:uncharacterized membrane protein YfcA